MAKEPDKIEIPLSIALGQQDLSDALHDIYYYAILEKVFNLCQIERSKDRDPSVTTQALLPFLGGLEQYQVQLRVKLLAKGPRPTVTVKDEGRTWRIRLTDYGLSTMYSIQQKAVKRRSDFIALTKRRDREIRRKVGSNYKRRESIVDNIHSEIAKSVQNDLGRTIRLLASFYDIPGPKKESLGIADQPFVTACAEMRERLIRKESIRMLDKSQAQLVKKDADIIQKYITDVAQREITCYLVSSRYASMVADLEERKPDQGRLLIIMDLSVVIAILCESDRLSIPAKECLVTAEYLRMGERNGFHAEFAIPAGFYTALQQQLERTTQKYERMRTLWKPEYMQRMPEDATSRRILINLAKFSVFREFLFGWPYDNFSDFANVTLAAFRRLTRKHQVVAASVPMPDLKQYHQYIQTVRNTVHDQRKKESVVLWTFDEQLSRHSSSIYGGLLHDFLKPDRLTKIRKKEQELEALRSLRWWRHGLLGKDLVQFRKDVTKEFRMALDRKYTSVSNLVPSLPV